MRPLFLPFLKSPNTAILHFQLYRWNLETSEGSSSAKSVQFRRVLPLPDESMRFKFRNPGFEHLHRHTDYSVLDGYATIEEYAKRSSQVNQKFLCISDHGSMGAVPRQIAACEKYKLEPIFACELYINPYQPELGKQWKTMAEYKEQLPPDIAGRLRKSNHLLAIAYNQEGYKNLVNMSSWAWIHGSYYKPRINHDILKAHKDGLIFTSCCYNSEIGQAFDTGGDDAGYDMIQKYLDMVGRENFYLEIMLLDFSKQKPYNQFIIRAADKFGLPIILTNDCHYCLAEDSHMQRLMLMVQTGRTIKEIQDALAKEDMADMFELQDKNLYMKSELELNEKYEKDFSDTIPLEIFEQAKANTLLIAERAKGVTLDRSIKLPQLPDADAKLKEEIFKGFKKRRLPLTKQYSQRLEEEYNLICQKGFSSYFLIQQMMTDEARRKCKELLGYGDGSEAVGPGRGSAVGALSCYCLGITDVNPIEHDLLFSRFLSPARGGKTMKLRFSIDPINAQDILDDIPFQVPEETSAAERPIDIN